MKTHLDWSSYKDAGMGDAYADIPKTGGDFAKAISVCINSKQCETKQKGVMCPSFRVTDRGSLSTGGRVRLLKAALNGELGNVPFANPNLAEAMDLCVACKGCKRECENEVDMAMIKIEYLAQRHEQAKPSLRTRLLANLSANIQYYGCFRYLPKLRNRFSLLAKLGEVVLGLSAKRKLPELAKVSFEKRQADKNQNSQPLIKEQSIVGEVVLLLDTFTNNICPENAEAAIRVLNRAGYKVHIAEADAKHSDTSRPLCCGRTQLANGLVEEAKENARRMIDALLPHVQAGRQVIGLEPACLLAIRDDYKFLGLGPAADKVASHAVLFEEFIAKEYQAKRFALEFKPVETTSPLLVHGHCHQKAVGAMKSMRKVLKMVPGLDFELVESSCCGMAGSFGLEKEHADIAMQMAEDSLLPSLRAQPQSRVVANGFSCRHQIKEGVNRSATHLAVLLDEALPT
jgi:glycerol-3-phosphate dehydrogenase subunit C